MIAVKLFLFLTLITNCIFLFAACNFMKEKEYPIMPIAKQVQHPNGLEVGIPKGFTERQTDDGFIIEPENNGNSKLRHPIIVYVTLKKNADTSQNSSFQTKTLAGKEIHYHIEKSEGGSGGETYTLGAFENVPNGQIEYSQAMQSEYSEPDFALVWSIIQTTKLK